MLLTVRPLVFIAFLCFFLCSPTFGLECYSCNEASSGGSCNEPTRTTCLSGEEYCGKIVLTTSKLYGKVVKLCLPSVDNQCESTPTDQNPSEKSGTVHCCRGDLCNGSSKLSNQNVLLYAVALSCFYILVNCL